MNRLDRIREDLDLLRRRMITGEIDETTYDRLKVKLLSDLKYEEYRELGVTPPPRSRRSLRPKGVETKVETLSRLDLSPGQVLLGRWTVVRELGRGGFGVVVEATDDQLDGDLVAVKVLDPKMVSDRALLARFKREVRVMRRLNHARVVRVFDYWEDLNQGLALISMELIKGGSVRHLQDFAAKGGKPIPVLVALRILNDILQGLAAVHAEGVVHRDITPGNVLLGGADPETLLGEDPPEPRAKLVDFGISGLVDRTLLSQKSQVLGTAAYVAPEVLTASEEVGPAADLYSAGAVAYSLLTGRFAQGRFRLPSQLRSGIPEGTDSLIDAMLQFEAGDRPGVDEALAGCRELLEGAGEAQADTARRRRLKELKEKIAELSTALEVALEARDEAGLRRIFEEAESLQAGAIDQSGAAREYLGACDAEREEAERVRREMKVEQKAATRLTVLREAVSTAIEARVENRLKQAVEDLRKALGGAAGSDEYVTRGEQCLKSLRAERKEANIHRSSFILQHPGQAEAKQYLGREAPKNPRPGDVWIEPVLRIRFRYIPAGNFMMGSPENESERAIDESQHLVKLTKGFWMGETAVTQGQWKTLKGSNPSRFSSCGGVCPVEKVSWFDAVKYANTLSRKAGLGECYREEKKHVGKGKWIWEGSQGFRLPTEAEWEYAARAGVVGRYAGGNDLSAVGWYKKNSGATTHRVGVKMANAWGLFDMSGNVWEWVWDWYGDYPEGSVTDPRGPSSGSLRVLRGGSWFNFSRYCRSALRGDLSPDNRSYVLGFRLARTSA